MDLPRQEGRAVVTDQRADRADQRRVAAHRGGELGQSSVQPLGLLLAAVPEDPASAGPVRPRPVHRVMAAIDADPARAWAPADLAEVAGVSVRRLQQAFREHVGTTPFGHLLDVRLDRVRDDLRSARGGSVTEVATAWGFTHLGRFAAAYRQRFGELPSQTLGGAA